MWLNGLCSVIFLLKLCVCVCFSFRLTQDVDSTWRAMSKRKCDQDEELTLREAADLVVTGFGTTSPAPRPESHTSVVEQAEALGRWAAKVVEALTWIS